MAEPDSRRIAEADALVRQGMLPQAAAVLEAALEGFEADAPLWLRLAGLRRALNQPRRSLDAVHRALARTPLDFMALGMRASLLEAMGDPEAGRAWQYAIAQKPDGPLPDPLAKMVAAGTQFRDRWLAQQEELLIGAGRGAAVPMDSDEQAKIDRFCSNIVRRTKVYHSKPSLYFYPGLSMREFHPRAHFPWLAELDAMAPVIKAEFEALMRSERAELMPYLQFPDYEPVQEMRELNHNPDWTAIHLIRNGHRIDANADQCPRTMEFLGRLHQPVIPAASPTAMFSLLAPHTTIPPHNGVNNSRLLCHLPLIVPDGCWFRVGAETRPWREGEALVFDDTIEHEAHNPTDLLRVILIFDIWHPDLSEAECDAIAAVIGADSQAEPQQ